MEENHDAKQGQAGGSGHAGFRGPTGDGGVLGATQQPLVIALFGGLNAAATVLAVVFLAGGVVRKDHGMLAFGALLVVGAATAAVAPRWLGKGQFPRTRVGVLGLFIALGLAVAGRGLWALADAAGGKLRRPASHGVSQAAAGSRDVLLVTLEEENGPAPGAIDIASTPGAFEVGDYFPSSPRREPCLASVLTGLEVIEHRLLFDGGTTAPHAVTAAEVFLNRGYSTHGFGRFGMPGWARRGVQEDALESRTRGPLAAAIALLSRPSQRPRFVHVHLKDYGLARAVSAATRAAEGAGGDGAAVAVVLLPSAGVKALPSRLWWAGAGGSVAGHGPVSSVSILPALLACAGAPPLGDPVDGPVLFGDLQGGAEVSQVPAITFAHGASGAVHDLVAQVGDWTVELTLTPLGRGPFDDWQIDAPFSEHLVYRNGVRARHRATGATPNAPTLKRVIQRLVDWRMQNGSFEERE